MGGTSYDHCRLGVKEIFFFISAPTVFFEQLEKTTNHNGQQSRSDLEEIFKDECNSQHVFGIRLLISDIIIDVVVT